MQKMVLPNPHRALASLCAAGFFLTAGLAFGQSGFETDEGALASLTENYVYYYVIREYSAPIPIEQAIPKESETTAEATALRHFRAVLDADYKSWLVLWDAESQELIEGRNRESGRTREFYEERWAQASKGYSECALQRRVESADFVIIEMTCENVDDLDGEGLSLDVPLVKDEHGEWTATQKFASDPVLHNWRQNGATINRVVREPPPGWTN